MALACIVWEKFQVNPFRNTEKDRLEKTDIQYNGNSLLQRGDHNKWVQNMQPNLHKTS